MGVNFNLTDSIPLVQLPAYSGASSFSEKIFEKKSVTGTATRDIGHLKSDVI
jgi:hypothetical protein